MDAKLREYLKRQGVSDAALDKIERGQVPDDDGALRKRGDDSLLDKFRQCEEMLKEMQEILDRIEKSDRQRGSIQKFAAGTPITGAADLTTMDLEGTPQ
jgi:hypothetical protein